MEKFPCLALAFQACQTGGTLPAVLNAANEAAVYAFLAHRIGFADIPAIIRSTMEQHAIVENPTLSDILEADAWARKEAGEVQ
jgi:1-deoxy-D-xylulose-5-phosphate reductoisomerase